MEKVKKIRIEVGMTQKQLAHELSINHTNFNKIEAGKLIPNTINDIEKRAIKILMPLLVNKIMLLREEMNRLEWLTTQIK